ncbi:MAG: hypothetical protein ABGX41_11775, partial [Pseudohongiella sp.]
GIMEQKMTGNDLRAREAQEAAEAGLEYGIAWASKNYIMGDVLTCTTANEPDCPVHSPVSGFSTSETYSYTLIFTKVTVTICSDPIYTTELACVGIGETWESTLLVRVQSTSQGNADKNISAKAETFIKQDSFDLFDSGATMPPPWVVAGCIESPTGHPDIYVLDSSSVSIISGSSDSLSTCLPEGNLTITEWDDTDENGIKDNTESGAVVSPFENSIGNFNCGGAINCSWDHAFDMPLAEAKQLATTAGHVYDASTLIPCGASSSPSIYLINDDNPQNSADITGNCSAANLAGVDDATIGVPGEPILLIVPASANCPKFNGGITIYGIIYYESTTACASNGWGGATVYGSVIWEGDVERPNSNPDFIEVDYGSGDTLNNSFHTTINDAARLPGTWKDF